MPITTSTFIPLPLPRHDGPTSVEAALWARRSVRSYANRPLSLPELAQLLWAGQGISDARDFRTAPSAGALYPLEILISVSLVDYLPAGIYRYQPDGHQLIPVATGDQRNVLAQAALNQTAVSKAPVVLAITGDYQKTTVKYGERGIRYVHLEAGHVAQNISLQATALTLDTVVIAAFSDQEVAAILRSRKQQVLYLVAVGAKREEEPEPSTDE